MQLHTEPSLKKRACWQDKANKAYDSAAGAAHEATRQPTAFEKAKGYLSPPSTADKVKVRALVDANAKGQQPSHIEMHASVSRVDNALPRPAEFAKWSSWIMYPMPGRCHATTAAVQQLVLQASSAVADCPSLGYCSHQSH